MKIFTETVDGMSPMVLGHNEIAETNAGEQLDFSGKSQVVLRDRAGVTQMAFGSHKGGAIRRADR